jgi:hypothetical protein
MKNIKKIVTMVFSSLALCLVLMLASCGDDATQSEADRVKDILISGTWKVQTVGVGNTDQTLLYKNLTLTFTGANYTTTTNGANIWPASGGWSFTDDTAKTILRSDGVSMAVGEATTTKLVLSFQWNNTTIGPGRGESIAGPHVFTFGK